MPGSPDSLRFVAETQIKTISHIEGQNLIGYKSGIINLLFPNLLGFEKINLNTRYI